MLLNELYKPKIGNPLTTAVAGYYKTPNRMNSDLSEKLKKLGWTMLADPGAFSAVYGNPKKNYVIKINLNPDSAFADYASVIKKYRNKHFPKISDMKSMKFPDRGYMNTYYVYLIEKLHPISMDNKIFAKLISQIMDMPTTNINEIYKIFEEDWSRIKNTKEVIAYFRKNPSLVRAARIAGRNIGGHCNDMHSGNIMQRQDGTVVITDPYAY